MSRLLHRCPNPDCGVAWGTEEYSFQECDSCGWPMEDEDTILSSFDDDDDFEFDEEEFDHTDLMNLPHAKQLACEIIAAAAPHCQPVPDSASDIRMCYLAGSILRGKENPKDIEVVALPENRNRLGMALMDIGCKVIAGAFGGRYVKMLYKSMQVDFFMPQERDFWRIYAIRVGPAEYSHTTLAAAWSRAGWVGTDDGLRRRDECYRGPGDKWIVKTATPTLPPVWKSEQDFFQWLGETWVNPERRGCE